MTRRKEINDKVVDWIVHKAKTEYADDISLVLIYGSHINGTANSKSDVDCYYIPKTERGYGLGVGFIIEGVGYDLFPMSWERVIGIADLQECLLPLVGDVQVIYYGDLCDLERFKDIQSRLQSNLSNDEYVKKIAKKRCEDAYQMCAQMKLSDCFSEVRKIAGSVIMTLADAVAIYNHDYYHFGLKRQYEDLEKNFPDVPQNIAAGYRQVVASLNKDDVAKSAMGLFEDACDYMKISIVPQADSASNNDVAPNEIVASNKVAVPNEVVASNKAAVSNEDVASYKAAVPEDVNAYLLARLYEEICSTFNKIYVCCENGDYILAYLSAVCLQRDLDDAREAGCPPYDLLGYFNYAELAEFAKRTRIIENDFVQLIHSHGGHIKTFSSFEQFASAKL